MVQVISVCNKKGGVGKTSIAVNLSASLKKNGYEVLIIDLDPQGNAGEHISVILDEDEEGSEQIFRREALSSDEENPKIDEYIKSLIKISPKTGINIIPASDELESIHLSVDPYRADVPYILHKFAKRLTSYDYIVVDCPPSTQMITQNAIIAANQIFVPIVQDRFSMSGLIKFIETIEKINHFSKGHMDKEPGTIRILSNKLDNRLKLGKHLLEKIKEKYPEMVLETSIPTNSSIMNAQIAGMSVLEFSPTCKASKSLMELLKEINITKKTTKKKKAV
jgi:chromosome partitioning protein